MKNKTLKQMHCRLEAIFQMINRLDARITSNRADMSKFNDIVIRNFLAKKINRDRAIKNRLAASYASTLAGMYDKIISRDAEPLNVVQIAEGYHNAISLNRSI